MPELELPEDAYAKIEEAQRKYFSSPKGKKVKRRYFQSEKGKEAQHNYYERKTARNRFTEECVTFLQDNPGKTVEDFLQAKEQLDD